MHATQHRLMFGWGPTNRRSAPSDGAYRLGQTSYFLCFNYPPSPPAITYCYAILT